MKAISPVRSGLIPMLVFWFLVMGTLYLAMQHYLKPRQAQVLATGELVIERARDGHFYVPGQVNGVEVLFLVDTGASLVVVGEALARQARLPAGTPTLFKTANGDMQGRTVEGVVVTIGPATVRNVRVGVGLQGGDEKAALLGQSFLSQFDIRLQKDRMLLQAR